MGRVVLICGVVCVALDLLGPVTLTGRIVTLGILVVGLVLCFIEGWGNEQH